MTQKSQNLNTWSCRVGLFVFIYCCCLYGFFCGGGLKDMKNILLSAQKYCWLSSDLVIGHFDEHFQSKRG